MMWKSAPAWFRGIIDLALSVVFALIAISGIALYLAPSGRIAETLGWTFLGLNKDTWTNLHTYLGFAMIGIVAIHLIVGFNSMITMLKMGFKKAKKKTVVGLVLMTLIMTGGYFVFGALTGEGESDHEGTGSAVISNSSVEITGSMLKSYTLDQLAKAYDVPVDKLVAVLKSDYGIEAQPDELLEAIEVKNGLDREVFKEYLAEAIEKIRNNS